MAILPAAFAILPVADARDALAAGNLGLTFIWIPEVFARMPAGTVFLPLFFLALSCAAVSSLIAMVELATRALMDAGVTRARAVRLVIAVGVVMGLPSAVSLQVFENQDWVWGLALMISGLFIAVAAIRYDVDRFRTDMVDPPSGRSRSRPLWAWVLKYLVPVEFAAMFGWWIFQAATVIDPEGWWNPIRMYSVGTCVAQWVIALGLLGVFNRRLAARSLRPHATLG